MTTWKLAVLAGAVTAVSVTGVALALDRPGSADTDRRPPTTMVAQQRDAGSDRTDRQTGGRRGALMELMRDEDFRAELWALQDEAQRAMREWWDEYGDDPWSDEAREAMQTLREEQRARMQALLEKYGGVGPGDRGARGKGFFGLFGGGPPGGALMGGGPMGPPDGLWDWMRGHGGTDGRSGMGVGGPSGWGSSAGCGSATSRTL